MSEERQEYCVHTLLKPYAKGDTLQTDLEAMRVQLEEIERRLIPLLVTVQRALGKEPSISTRAERRTR